MLISKSNGKSHIYLEPLLIHRSQKFSCFVSQLVALKQQLRYIKTMGTDGKIAFYEVLSEVFPNEIYLRCFNH